MKNRPKYADNYQYIVARNVEGALWFYGAYNSLSKALKVATEINGVVVG